MSSMRMNKTLGRVVGSAACAVRQNRATTARKSIASLMPQMLADTVAFVHPFGRAHCGGLLLELSRHLGESGVIVDFGFATINRRFAHIFLVRCHALHRGVADGDVQHSPHAA